MTTIVFNYQKSFGYPDNEYSQSTSLTLPITERKYNLRHQWNEKMTAAGFYFRRANEPLQHLDVTMEPIPESDIDDLIRFIKSMGSDQSATTTINGTYVGEYMLSSTSVRITQIGKMVPALYKCSFTIRESPTAKRLT